MHCWDSPTTTKSSPDGKIFIGGFFSEFDGIERSRLALLNPDGSLDTAFMPPVLFGPGNIQAEGAATGNPLVQSDGKVLICGVFSHVDGVPRSSIARLNADGSLDPTFDPGAGAQTDEGQPGFTFYLDRQHDGKILTFGVFETFDGVEQRGLVRLVVDDGTADPPFFIEELSPLENGMIELRITKTDETPVVVQATQKFEAWVDVASNEEGPGTYPIVDEDAAGIAVRFYRLIRK